MNGISFVGYHRHAGGKSRSGTPDVFRRSKDGSFQDVHRACDRWLLERDPAYRQQKEDWYRRNPRHSRP